MALIAGGGAASGTLGVVLAVAATVVAPGLSAAAAGSSAHGFNAVFILLHQWRVLADNGLDVSDVGWDKLSQDGCHAVTWTFPAGMVVLPRCKRRGKN